MLQTTESRAGIGPESQSLASAVKKHVLRGAGTQGRRINVGSACQY